MDATHAGRDPIAYAAAQFAIMPSFVGIDVLAINTERDNYGKRAYIIS
jgi:hypothetical protein